MANFETLQKPALDPVMEKYYNLISLQNSRGFITPFIFEVNGVFYMVEWRLMKWDDPRQIDLLK